MKRIEFSRRAIGVSAAYFAVLHASVAFIGQLGGISGVGTLSPLFQWSLIAGLFGVIVLTLMALTSFDKVITVMTFRRWKWLHRLVYLGGILAVLHIWSIGTHVGYTFTQIAALMALIVLAGLEMFRLTTLISKKSQTKWSMEKFNGLFLVSWAVWVLLIALIPKYVDTYRSTDATAPHSEHGEQHTGTHEGENHEAE